MLRKCSKSSEIGVVIGVVKIDRKAEALEIQGFLNRYDKFMKLGIVGFLQKS